MPEHHMTPFESDALKGASSEAAREMKPFIEAVMELRKMPDAPENPTDDDEAMEQALAEWSYVELRGIIARNGFRAGWRAAMAEVAKSRAMGAEQARRASRDAQLEKLNAKIDNFCRGWDHSRERF